MKVYTYDHLEKNGRLGNQLWQIAATICRAEQNDGIARFHPDWEYRKFFSVPDEFFEPVPEGVEVIDGGTEYFQEYHFFAPIADKIQKYFEPNGGNMGALATKIARGRNIDWGQYQPSVAIHVRRGDYLKYPKHFPITSSEFYRAAVRDVQLKYDYPLRFYVFSDDLEWCRSNLDYFGIQHQNVTFSDGIVRPVEVEERVGEPSDQWDLFAMTCCDEHIISNSTFAWWGAYLSNNPSPIYPSKWWGPKVPNWKRWELAIPEGWRKFQC